MSKRDWRLFASEIVESIEKIEMYVEGLSYTDFLKDLKTRDAVVRNLEIIGESSKQIPLEVREKDPEIPWSQLVGLRNRLIHGYFVVSYEIVWEIIGNELPPLKGKIKKLLEVCEKEVRR